MCASVALSLGDGVLPWHDPLFVALVLAAVSMELLIPAWVYYDARKRGRSDAAVWLQVTVIPAINVLGLVAYLSARNRRPDDRD